MRGMRVCELLLRLDLERYGHKMVRQVRRIGDVEREDLGSVLRDLRGR